MQMVKGTTIFSDQRQKKKQIHIPAENAIRLSREEYRQLIKDAYQEGRSDALKEQRKKTTKNHKKSTIELKGKEEAIRVHAEEEEENRQRFETITARQDIEMLRAYSVFPFTIFTDIIIIDTTKVTISKKQLFATEYITTIPLKDLSDVNV